MKQIISIVTLSLCFFTSHAQDKKVETIIIKTKIYCDHCLKCNSCGDNINNAIYATPGIKRVTISPKENTITISYKPAKTSPEKIRKAITEAGFDADDMPASAAGFSKLDGCCKP